MAFALMVLTLMAQEGLADGGFNVSDRVWTTSDIVNLNIRDVPGTGNLSKVIGSAIKGSTGMVIEGPVDQDNYTWWKIKYDNGMIGWSVGSGLEPAPIAPQLPANFSSWAEEAIRWGEIRNGSSDWWDEINRQGYCLRFVANAFMQKYAEGQSVWNSPVEAASALYRFDQEPGGWANATRGAVILFDKEGGNSFGHVGIYLGEGRILHAYGTVQNTTIEDAMAHPDVGSYLGWSYPPDDWRPKTPDGDKSDAALQLNKTPAENQSAITDGRTKGIDVSDYQGSINWSQVAGSGYKFAFVKATEGEGFTGDPIARQQNFEINAEGASSAGLLVGAYHFARPDLGNNASDEARWFVNVTGSYIKPGYLRPVLDIEKGATTLGGTALSKWIGEWMETVKNETGVEPLIYTSADYSANYLNASLTRYDLWIAHWTYDINSTPDTGIWDGWEFWQYSNKGNVSGIAGDVDLDLFDGSEDDLSNFEITNGSLDQSRTKFVYRDVKLNGTITGSLSGSDSKIAAYKITVISINETFNKSEIADGDEIFLLNGSLCGRNLTSAGNITPVGNFTPTGSLYPTGWSPSAGDYVEVYARTSAFDRNWTAFGLNNSSKIVTICGEYGFYLRLSDIHPPVLFNGTVSPQSGRSIDDYTFSVVYRDEDGDEPSLADVRIIGFNGTRKIFDSPYTDMTWVSGDARTGARYEYTTKLPAGEYHYYFFFANQKNRVVYLPENGYPGFLAPAVGMSWPLRPFDAAHPVILGYGDFSIVSVHNAVDIQSTVGEGVYAVETGTVVRSDKNNAGGSDETLYIKGDYSNKIIQYTHIAMLERLKKDGARVNVRDLIGTVRECDESGSIQPHLHFAIVGDDIGDGVYVPGLENPLLLLEPRPDYGAPPEVKEIAFREDDAGKNESVSLRYFKKNPDGAYEVCGKVDIVASIADAMGASATAGAYRIGYSIRGKDNSSSDTDGILVEWNEPIRDVVAPLNIIYEQHPGYPRSSYYNSWYIVTNSRAGANQSQPGEISALSTEGCWNASAVPPGIYEVTVTAWDARGSVASSRTAEVKVTDAGTCRIPPASDQLSARIIEPIYLPQGDYTAGDLVPMSFTVVNTGKPAILYAAASVRGPDGAWLQMQEIENKSSRTLGNSTLKFQIDSGNTKFNAFAWAVTKNTTPGRYDVHIELRSDERLGETAGLLDEMTNLSQFQVPESRLRVDLHPEKTTYHPGDVARVVADVVNELGENATIWPQVGFRDPAGATARYRPLINVTPGWADLAAGESQPFSIQLSLPGDAPLGDYEISVDLFQDANLTQKHRDTVDWSRVFQVARPVNITPIDVIMVLDRSGSMEEFDSVCGESKMEMVKKAASFAATDALNSGPGNRVGVVSFSDWSSSDVDLTRDQNAIADEINVLHAGGATSYGAGLEVALNQMTAHGNFTSIPVILFMSDGWHNTWPEPQNYIPEYTGRGIKIFTMGVGESINQDLLEWMADETGGEYKAIRDCSELRRIFWTILNQATGYIDAGIQVDIAPDEEVNATIFEIPSGTVQLNLTLDSNESLADYKVYGPDRQPAAFTETGGQPKVLVFSNPVPGNYTIIFWRGVTPQSQNAAIGVPRQVNASFNNPGAVNSTQNASRNSTGSGRLRVMSASPFLTDLLFPILTASAQDRNSSSQPTNLDEILTGNESNYGYVKKNFSELLMTRTDQNYPVLAKSVSFPPNAEYLKITIVANQGPIDIAVLDPDKKPVNPAISYTNTSPETIILENPRAGNHTLLLYGIAAGDEVDLSIYERPQRPARDVIYVRERSGTDLPDYPVAIELAGKDFPDNAGIDGSDISFFDDSGTQLNYWIEDWNSSARTAKIWVKIPSLPANGEKNISMRSGAPGASGSDGYSVFRFFDDFEDDDLDVNRWSASSGSRANIAEHDGLAEVRVDAKSRATADLISTESFKPNVTMRFKGYVSKGQIGDCKGLGFIDSNVMQDANGVSSGVYWRGQKTDLANNYRYLTMKGQVEGKSKPFKSNYEAGWRIWEVKWMDFGIDYSMGSGVIHFKTKEKPSSGIASRFSISTTIASLPSGILVDWVLVRPCASIEPEIKFMKSSTGGV